MKLILSIIISVLICSTFGQEKLAQCRAELEKVHNEATLQIKNLTDTINEFLDNPSHNTTVGELLKEKMKKTASDINTKWNQFEKTMQKAFKDLGGKITNAWGNIFGNDGDSMAVLPEGVKIPTQTVNPDFTTPPSSSESFWDKVRGVFGK